MRQQEFVRRVERELDWSTAAREPILPVLGQAICSKHASKNLAPISFSPAPGSYLFPLLERSLRGRRSGKQNDYWRYWNDKVHVSVLFSRYSMDGD